MPLPPCRRRGPQGQHLLWPHNQPPKRRRATRGNPLAEENDPNFLTFFVDTANGFNNSSCKVMMWTMARRWLTGARFAFNMYRLLSVLILYRRGKEALMILSGEGVIQGDPLIMVLYALCTASLAKHIREEVPELF